MSGRLQAFPPPELARKDGLLAMGGDLEPERLILAYSEGIFPWFTQGEPILWWSPDPRCVLHPSDLMVTRRLERTIRRGGFRITFDHAFDDVIRSCAGVRIAAGEDTWICPEMIIAYRKLHALGLAHSAEAWLDGELAGGLYGVALGRVFFGESMFHRVRDASKVAFVTLVRTLASWGFAMIDCQMKTGHLMSLGAAEIPRAVFLRELRGLVSGKTSAPRDTWRRGVVHGA